MADVNVPNGVEDDLVDETASKDELGEETPVPQVAGIGARLKKRVFRAIVKVMPV